MHDKHQAAAANQIAREREHYQQDGDQVVNEHLEEVFALDVHELREQQRPIATQLEDVIELDVPVEILLKENKMR